MFRFFVCAFHIGLDFFTSQHQFADSVERLKLRAQAGAALLTCGAAYGSWPYRCFTAPSSLRVEGPKLQSSQDSSHSLQSYGFPVFGCL